MGRKSRVAAEVEAMELGLKLAGVCGDANKYMKEVTTAWTKSAAAYLWGLDAGGKLKPDTVDVMMDAVRKDLVELLGRVEMKVKVDGTGGLERVRELEEEVRRLRGTVEMLLDGMGEG